MSAHLKSTGLWLAACLLLLASWPVLAGTVVTYYHVDAQGTPVAATDAVGTVLWRETHDPYGARHTRQSDVEADPLQYTGNAEEPETGLVYLGSRVYDPSIGRFTGFDPAPVEAGEPRTFSRYGYAYNNPYGYADPGGESPVDVAFLAVDVLRLSLAIYSGNAAAIQSAAVDTAISAAGVLNPIPLSGQAAKAAVFASRSKAATEGVAAAKGVKPDFIVSRDGAVVHSSPDKVRASLDGSGSQGKSVQNAAGTESGTIHNIPDMKMDVRVMDGGPNHPARVVTSRQGTSQPVNPSNGSNFGNVPKVEQRERSHIVFP